MPEPVSAPVVRFRPDLRCVAHSGWPAVEGLVPQDHPVRLIWSVVEQIDTTAFEGREHRRRQPPYHPRWLLALWVHASRIGLHTAEALCRQLKTDAALRWLAGGHTPSSPTLKRFRRKGGELFAVANERVLSLAHERGLLDTSELAVDSLRLRADASTSAVRTVRRSKRRLAELQAVDTSGLTEEEQARHTAKLAKHEGALQALADQDRTNLVLSAPGAGLLKFPNGASAPGYRVTAMAAGRRRRFILHVFLTADNCDYGHLERAVIGTRELLDRIEARPDQLLITADPGYHSEADLKFARDNRHWADVLIREGSTTRRSASGKPGYFSREDFDFRSDNTVICPAGRTMIGPRLYKGEELWWRGDDCASCPLKPRCTKSKDDRVVTLRPEFEVARAEMRARMAQPDAAAMYGGRMAIVEPVFASLEDAFRFQRASSRDLVTVQAEVILKVLAHNIGRLLHACTLRAVWLVVGCDDLDY